MKLRTRLAATTLTALLAALAALALSGCARPAQNTIARTADPQVSFATPEGAVEALVAAGEKQDVAGLHALLGPGTGALLSSGDPVADRRAREAFLARYRARHELIADGPNDFALLLGEERLPFAIPLVRTGGRWFWDGAAGAPELLSRRIEANQRRTIAVLKSFVGAEEQYAAVGHDGGPPGVYAQKLRSTSGKRDGLYWDTAAGEPQSPASPLLAAAAAEGYSVGRVGGAPYHGYVFRLLTSQGPSARGGARDYLASGKLTGGFAALAYPDAYGSSGVMTYMVSQEGVVWQRDLGQGTGAAAATIRQFDPNDTWAPVASESSAGTAPQGSAIAPPIRSASRR